MIDPDEGGEPGPGTYDVTIDGVQYQDDAAMSLATVITDDTDGKTYAVWVALQQTDDGMDPSLCNRHVLFRAPIRTLRVQPTGA